MRKICWIIRWVFPGDCGEVAFFDYKKAQAFRRHKVSECPLEGTITCTQEMR